MDPVDLLKRAEDCAAAFDRCQFMSSRALAAPIDNGQFFIIAACVAAAFVTGVFSWQFSSVTLFRGQGRAMRQLLGMAFGIAAGAWAFNAVDRRLEPAPGPNDVVFRADGTDAERRSINDTKAWMSLQPDSPVADDQPHFQIHTTRGQRRGGTSP